MSQMTRIRITHEQGFASRECLEEALASHGLLTMVSILRVGDKFQLDKTIRSRDVNRVKLETELKKELDRVVQTIIPTYTKLLATDDFNEQGFYLKRTMQDVDEELLIFEKIHCFSERNVPEQIVLRIRKDYTLDLETLRFTGNKCVDTR